MFRVGEISIGVDCRCEGDFRSLVGLGAGGSAVVRRRVRENPYVAGGPLRRRCSGVQA